VTSASAIRERPILFSGPMVRAILDRRKTQTRRVVKPQPVLSGCVWSIPGASRPARTYGIRAWGDGSPPFGELLAACPYGAVADRLWVRETLSVCGQGIEYAADGEMCWDIMGRSWEAQGESLWAHYDHLDGPDLHPTLIPSIFAPRWTSRITLEITDVRVERLQEISEDDAIDEGCDRDYVPLTDGEGEWSGVMITARDRYRALWDLLNAKRGHSWDSNPWVWVIEFRRAEATT
jgi:hypothetical protein